MKELTFAIKSGFTTHELVHSPDGWDDAILDIERSTTMLGIVRSYSIQLKFMLDGAKILRDIYYNKIQNETSLTLKKLNRLTLQYEDLFTGIFDFSTFVDTDYSVEVTILDNSLANYIKRNLDKQYNVTFTTSRLFYHWDNQTAVKPTKYIHFYELLYNLLDMVVEGKLASGDFSLDQNAIIPSTEERKVITNSIALQGGEFDSVTISLRDMLQDLFVLWQMVATIKIVDGTQTLIIKSVESTFPELASFEIDEVSNFKLSFAKDFLFDSIAVGFPTQESDSILPYEFGATAKFSNSSAFIVNKELDLISKIRGDVTGITQYADQYGFPDTSINEMFIISIHYYEQSDLFRLNTGGVRLGNGTYQGIANTSISPKRLLLNHERFINSCFFGSGQNVYFSSAPFNIARLQTITYIPDATNQYEGSGYERTLTPYFAPINFEFEALMPDTFKYNSIVYPFYFNALSIPELLRFRFQYEGNFYEGFLMSMKLNVSGRKNKATFTLLAAHNNDFTKLIR